jgi:hypothetical protein
VGPRRSNLRLLFVLTGASQVLRSFGSLMTHGLTHGRVKRPPEFRRRVKVNGTGTTSYRSAPGTDSGTLPQDGKDAWIVSLTFATTERSATRGTHSSRAPGSMSVEPEPVDLSAAAEQDEPAAQPRKDEVEQAKEHG